ncbi:MAG: stage V sporulation protein AE [Oscillospiraceae bacterium]|nr:stage V sporulation protein AE [Oscillospiraceae bacterium]
MNYLWAFLIGGALCAVGQVLISYTKLTPARILVIYVVAGVVLGAFGLYRPLIDLAGAGASVPLTGFGNLLAEGVREAVDTKGLVGVLTGGLGAAAAGITAAIFFGLLAGLCFKSKEK